MCLITLLCNVFTPQDNFSGVPETMICDARHPIFNYDERLFGDEAVDVMKLPLKRGSLQEFIQYDDLAGDLAPKKFPTREVHKIGILDIRCVLPLWCCQVRACAGVVRTRVCNLCGFVCVCCFVHGHWRVQLIGCDTHTQALKSRSQ